MRSLKMVGLIGAAVFGLLLICIGLFAGFFNPNDYKPRLQAWVEAQTGRTFTITGPLRLQLWPALGFSASQFALGEVPTFGSEPLMSGQEVTFHLRWLPLLQRRLAFGAVTLQGVDIRVVTNADGSNNWQALLQRFAQMPGNAATQSGLQFGELRDIEVRDAQMNYQDRRNGRTLRVEGFALRARDVRLQRPFELSGAARVTVDTHLVLQWQWHMTVQLDMAQQRYVLSQPQLSGRVTGEGWPTAGVPLAVAATRIEYDHANGRAVLDELQVEVAQAVLHGQLSIDGLNTQPQLVGRLRLAPLNLRDWAERMGRPLPAMNAADALNAFAAEWDLHADANSLTVRVSQLQLDETHMSGQLHVRDFSVPQFTFELQADRINLDRYLSTASTTSAPQPVPLQWLRELQAQGRIAVDQAQWRGVRTQHLVLQVDGT